MFLLTYLSALLDPQFADDDIVNCSSDSAPVIVLAVLVEFDLHGEINKYIGEER